MLQFHQLKFMPYFTSFVIISTVFVTASSGVDSVSRNYFLCSSIRSNSPFITVLSWYCSNPVTSSGSTSDFSYLAISITSAVPPPLKCWTPQSYPWGLESTSFKLLLILIFWPLLMNHRCSYWHLEWWILFRTFSFTLHGSIRAITVYVSYNLVKCFS